MKRNAASKMRKAIDRPFERRVWDHASAIARTYRLIIEHESDGFRGRVLEMPTVFMFGGTPNECLEETIQALTTVLATMLEEGTTPPTGGQQRRSQQINIRLTPEEKLLLEDKVRRTGFRNVSDYMRHLAIVEPRSQR